jgi:hypothetical protein
LAPVFKKSLDSWVNEKALKLLEAWEAGDQLLLAP